MPLHPGTLSLTSFRPDPGVLPKIIDPCGQERAFLLPAYSSLQADLSTHSARVCHSHSSLGLHLPGTPSTLLRLSPVLRSVLPPLQEAPLAS